MSKPNKQELSDKELEQITGGANDEPKYECKYDVVYIKLDTEPTEPFVIQEGDP